MPNQPEAKPVVGEKDKKEKTEPDSKKSVAAKKGQSAPKEKVKKEKSAPVKSEAVAKVKTEPKKENKK